MGTWIPSARAVVDRWLAPPEATEEDRRKRTTILVCAAALAPVVLTFGIEDLRQGALREGAAVLGMALFLTATPFLMARMQDVTPLFRTGAFLTLLLQLYELEIGGGEGFAFLWFYCFPILALTLAGKREGAVWVVAGLAGAAWVFATPTGYSYELERALRFLLSYVIVGYFSYALESARNRFYAQLLDEKAVLEGALLQVRTLRGLLPICTECKRIRDDRGDWLQFELYVDRHSDAEFSHGVCPDCYEQLHHRRP